jgi:kynureninase
MVMADPLLKWRSEFPILEKKKGYLISNSLGAMPRRTYDNLKAYADAWATDGVLAWHDWLPMVVQTGDLIGKLIGAPAGSVMMHQNVANATQMVLSCFDWKAPRNRIVATDLNFPSVPYNYFAQQGAETVLVKGEGTSVPIERILAAIDERTALVSLDLVLFRSAAILDVKPIIARAHAVGAKVVLDCYQATGAIEIDATALDTDFLMGGSVKWLCGGPGAGYLYVKPALMKSLQPRFTGWFSHKRPFGFETGGVDPAEDIHRFMGGSPAVPALYAARAGYEIVGEVGVRAIREKSVRMTEQLIALADAQGLTVNTPRVARERGGTVCVDFPGSEAAHHRLIERGYVIDWRPNCGIRISPHFYNTEGELEGIMAEIKKLRA